MKGSQKSRKSVDLPVAHLSQYKRDDVKPVGANGARVAQAADGTRFFGTIGLCNAAAGVMLSNFK